MSDESREEYFLTIARIQCTFKEIFVSNDRPQTLTYSEHANTREIEAKTCAQASGDNETCLEALSLFAHRDHQIPIKEAATSPTNTQIILGG